MESNYLLEYLENIISGCEQLRNLDIKDRDWNTVEDYIWNFVNDCDIYRLKDHIRDDYKLLVNLAYRFDYDLLTEFMDTLYRDFYYEYNLHFDELSSDNKTHYKRSKNLFPSIINSLHKQAIMDDDKDLEYYYYYLLDDIGHMNGEVKFRADLYLNYENGKFYTDNTSHYKLFTHVNSTLNSVGNGVIKHFSSDKNNYLNHKKIAALANPNVDIISGIKKNDQFHFYAKCIDRDNLTKETPEELVKRVNNLILYKKYDDAKNAVVYFLTHSEGFDPDVIKLYRYFCPENKLLNDLLEALGVADEIKEEEKMLYSFNYQFNDIDNYVSQAFAGNFEMPRELSGTEKGLVYAIIAREAYKIGNIDLGKEYLYQARKYSKFPEVNYFINFIERNKINFTKPEMFEDELAKEIKRLCK